MNNTSLLEHVQRASFIFAGTVTKVVGSSVRVLPPRRGLAVLQLRRTFFQDPVLGNLEGRPVTVQLAGQGAGNHAVEAGEKLVFFATAWVHSDQIAVTEISRLPDDEKTESEIVKLVESLPERHLAERVARALVIAVATVRRIEPARVSSMSSEHDPAWMRAELQVSDVLKGEIKGRRRAAVLLFPGSRDRAFSDVPRPTQRQTALFLLHAPPPQLPSDAYIAPDPADVRPPSHANRIRALVQQSGPPSVGK